MKTAIFFVGLCALLLSVAAETARAQMTMNGAGATFPYPIYSKWFDEYAKVDPSVQIQLPIDRFRRRAEANHRADGRFWRI